MKKSVEVLCPGRLTLFYNEGITKDKEEKRQLINQTIDLYDKLEICFAKKRENNTIIRGVKTNYELEKLLLKTSKLFFEYANLENKNLNISIEKYIQSDLGLNSTDSLLAGLLKALNAYYNNILTNKQLTNLASSIGKEIPYYLVGGYCLIKDEITNIKKLTNNPYLSYLLIKPDYKIDLPSINPYYEQPISKTLYNDYLKYLETELIDLKKYLKEKKYDYNLLAKGPLYFLALKEKCGLGSLEKEIHSYFSNYKLTKVNNSNGLKLLVKYNNLDIYK